MLLWDRRKNKPNLALEGQLITPLVTSNFWEKVMLHSN